MRCPPACMPKDGSSWKGRTIGKWVECMSVAAIVLGILGSVFFWYLFWHSDWHWFFFGDFATFVVGICGLINKCAVHNGCFFTVLWIIMLIVAIVSSVLMAVFLILVLIAIYWCGSGYHYDYHYHNMEYCTLMYIVIAIYLLFAIPFVIFQWIYTFILFRAERIQKRCEERDFP
ncbi:hypothetical protein AAVH_31211 [Aphelenchoides avenae]|nr:hypothetical protein AAVH_31211 [Aphelenchus avenae]